MVRLAALFVLPVLLVMASCASGGRGAGGQGAVAKAPDVRTKEVVYMVENRPYRGVVAWDANAEGKRPGILVCHEWWGNNEYMTRRAEMLAREGYVAFALDMFGEGKVTKDPADAQAWTKALYDNPSDLRTRAAAGLRVLRAQPGVDASRIAAIGYCFGGTVALEVGRSGVAGGDLKAIVPFHTSSLTAKNPADNRNIKGRVLLCTGAADPMVPAEAVAAFEKEMAAAGVRYDVESYAGAKHSFTNPDADSFGFDAVAYNKAADEQSWEAMMRLFAEAF